MRIAVMSDIHGFDLALETVMTDLARKGHFDEVVVAGDLCAVGPAPATVLRLLSASNFFVLRGNTDRDLVEAARSGTADSEARYALEQIGDVGVEYLENLPFARRISPPASSGPADDLLVVHANPRDLERKLTPDMSDDQLREVIGDTEAAAIAFGHHHVAFIRTVDNMLLCDVSAVGNPKDGDLRCKYGVIRWDEDHRRWEAEILRLDYPLGATVTEIRGSNLPDPEAAIAKLLRASY